MILGRWLRIRIGKVSNLTVIQSQSVTEQPAVCAFSQSYQTWQEIHISHNFTVFECVSDKVLSAPHMPMTLRYWGLCRAVYLVRDSLACTLWLEQRMTVKTQVM